MALTKKISGQPSPIQKELEHVYKAITDGTLTTLVSGVTGKRIRVWRFHAVAAVKDKTCALLSATNPFPMMSASASVLCHHLKSSDGIAVFTCNAGEDFKADPSDSTNWYFYIVYSIE